jgi:pyruvate dehydrogenase E1 component beta subunit
MSRQDGQNIVVFGEDVGKLGGVFRATKHLQEEFGEKRCFDFPIAEASLVGVAVGMAINGLKPVVEIQFSGFVFPALQNLFCHVARYRNRTRGRFSCPIVVRMPVGA